MYTINIRTVQRITQVQEMGVTLNKGEVEELKKLLESIELDDMEA